MRTRTFCGALLLGLAFGSFGLRAEVTPDGSFRTTVPIEIPPGTRGLAPSLALEYNSGDGDGFAGLGWRLTGLPVIQRVAFGNALRYDGTDTYSGPAGRLADVSGNKTEYRSVDESWGRYVPTYGNCGAPAAEPCSWVLQEKGGLRLSFGTTEDSRIQAAGRSGAVRVWALSRVEDADGNFYTVAWDEDTAGGDYYPKLVTYTQGHGLAKLRTVELELEPRPDHAAVYDQGTRIDADRRLKAVTVKVDGQLVRQYRMGYAAGATTDASRLVSVQEFGSDGVTALPAQTFTWRDGATGFGTQTLWWDSKGNNGRNYPLSSSADGDYLKLLDVNGDGRPDRVAHYNYENSFSGLWVALNNGQGFSPQTQWQPLTYGYNNHPRWQYQSSDAVTLLDMDGDGRLDRVQHFNSELSSPGLWVSINTGAGFARPALWWDSKGDNWRNYPQWAGGDGIYTQLLDMNGDQLPDRVAHYNYDVTPPVPGLWVALNTGSGFWPQTLWWDSKGANGRNYPRQADGAGQYSTLLDMNGDGRPDRVMHMNWDTNVPGLWVALNTGTGFGPLALWWDSKGNNGRNQSQWSNASGLMLQMIDMNGDRLPDRVAHFNYDVTPPVPGLWVALNTGSGFAPQSMWWDSKGDNGRNNPLFREGGNILNQLQDMNGDGRPDRVAHYNYDTSQPGLWVALNTGSGFAAQTLWFPPSSVGQGFPQAGGDGGTYCMYTDVNGDGFPDRAASVLHEAPNTPGLYVALSRVEAPRITAVSNGLGGTTAVEYAQPDLAQALRPDATSCGGVSGGAVTGYGKPCGIANASPRLVASRVTVSDGRGNARSWRYEYGNGRVAPGAAADRVNLGFEWMKETDEATGAAARTTFRQDRPLQGRLMKVERLGGDGGVLVRQESSYEAVAPRPGTTFVRLTQRNETAFEAGLPAFTSRRSLAWDDWGFTVSETDCADVQCKVTATSYTHDPVQWRLGRVDEVKTTANGVILDWERLSWSGTHLVQRSKLLCPQAPQCLSEAFGTWGPVVQGITYDSFGNRTAETDALGRTSRTTWDADFATFAATTIDAKGFTVARTWTPSGRPLTVTDANGNVTRYSYDALGRPAESVDPAGRRTAFVYRGYGDPRAQYDGTEAEDDGRLTWTRNYFDGLRQTYRVESTGDEGRVIARDTETGVTGRTRFTRVSRPRYSDEPPVWTTTEEDDLGRKQKVTRFDGQVFLYRYAPGTVQRTVGAQTSQEVVDGRGRLVRQVDPLGQETLYHYDPAGRLAAVTLPNRSTVTAEYDSLGRRTRLIDPALGTLTADWDAVGNLVRTTDARGRATTFTWDELNRPLTRRTASGATVTYTWDDPAVANSRGRMTRVDDPSGSTELAYDAFGRITRTAVTLDGLPDPFVETLTYDRQGRPLRLTYPDGSIQEYTYTAGGNLASLRLDNGTLDGVFGLFPYAVFSRYSAAGQVGRKELLTGVRTDYTWDRERLARLVTRNADGQTFQDLAYAWDGDGQITGITDRRASTLDGDVDTRETQAFQYDALHRLVAATGVYGAKTFAYDPLGNLSHLGGRVDRDLASAGPRLVSGTGVTATWDDAGNLASKTLDGVAWAYAYDDDGRLVEVRKGGALLVELSYNYLGERVKKVYHRPGGSTLTTWYVGRGYEMRQDSELSTHTLTRHLYAREIGKVATVTREEAGILGGPEALALTGSTVEGVPPGTWFYHPTHVGSAAVITDGQGQETTRLLYLPYGEIDEAHSVGRDLVTHKFTGQELDEETGLVYFRARYYDPAIGRFLTPDSQLPGNGLRPQGFNRYAYAEGNPILFNDPSGHKKRHHGCSNIFCQAASAFSNAARDAQRALAKAAEDAQRAAQKAADDARQEAARVQAELDRQRQQVEAAARQAAENVSRNLQQTLNNPAVIVQSAAEKTRGLIYSNANGLADTLRDQRWIGRRESDFAAVGLEVGTYVTLDVFGGGAGAVLRKIPGPEEEWLEGHRETYRDDARGRLREQAFTAYDTLGGLLRPTGSSGGPGVDLAVQ